MSSLNNIYPGLVDRMEAYLMSQFQTPPSMVPPSIYALHQGLPPGSKPPPLTMISPAGSKLSRNTATVPPLNQVSPSNGVNSVAASAALNASRTSSFAAALRKLAQAKDPAEEGSVKQSNSTSTSPRATTPKRGPPPLVYNTQSSTSLTSPPVVTIAPTQSHQSIVSGEMRQSLDRAHSVQSSVSSAYDQPIGLKQERSERPQSTHSNSRDDDRLSVKDLQNSRSRMTPHSGHRSSSPSAGLRDEAVVRGFQPYRHGDDVRHQLPPAYGLDTSAYPYPAFLPPHPFPHPAFRFDDPLLLERYRMMQPHYLPFGHPGLLPPTGVHPFLAGGRYPAELLHQQLPFVSQASALPDQIAAVLTERQRLEEERLREFEREREREKEREAILLREKEKARDREKEYDKERTKEQYQQQHSIEHRTEKKIDHTFEREIHRERERASEKEFHKDSSYDRNLHNSRDRVSEQDRYQHTLGDTQRNRNESSGINEHRSSRSEDDIGRRFGSITQGTPRDSSYGERSTIPLPSNISEQYCTSTKRKEEKTHYNHVKGQPIQKAVNMDLIKQEYDRDKRYVDRDSSRTNHSTNDLLHKSGKNSDSFFRPFDTILTNGYNGSDVSSEFEKYSTTQKQIDHIKHHSDKPKTSHVEPFYHRQSSGEQTKMNSTNHDQNKNSEFSFATYMSQLKQNDLQNSNLSKSYDQMFSHRTSSSHSSKLIDSYIKKETSESRVASKLDLDEKLLKEKRARGQYLSDSDSDSDDLSEERRQVRLMMITTGPPLPLDESEQKLKFLSQIELTSHRVKKELQYEKFRKRRKFHREPSFSPVHFNEEESERTTTPLRIPSDHKSEDLCHEPDFPDKCSFLGSFSLGTIKSNKKKELQHIRSVCDNERSRRLSGQISDNSTGHGCKRKLDEVGNSGSEISRKICLKASDHKLRADSVQQQNSGHVIKSTNQDCRTVLFPDHNDHKVVLSREFAQEFHESVLQTTRQKELNNRLGISSFKPQDTTASTIDSNNPLRHSAGNDTIGTSRSHDHLTNKYKWPGMEVLLGAYQRHSQEQNLEKKILIDRCRHLQNENKDLNKMAESLSRKMAELLENKRMVDQSRSSCQSAIDNIKKSMHALR